MTPVQERALRAALELPYPAFPVVIVDEVKKPACRNGFYDACTAVTGLATLWARSPGDFIGVPTGPVSGLAVLDIDRTKVDKNGRIKKGGEEWWGAHKYRLPGTRQHRTQSGGIHNIFKHRPGLTSRAPAIDPDGDGYKKLQGVDIRAEGGYVVWWATEGLPVNDLPIADWPAWWTDPKPEPIQYERAKPRVEGTAYAMRYEGTIRGALDDVARAPVGGRNETLRDKTWKIAHLVKDGAVQRDYAWDGLQAAALASGLSAHETRITISRAFRKLGIG